VNSVHIDFPSVTIGDLVLPGHPLMVSVSVVAFSMAVLFGHLALRSSKRPSIVGYWALCSLTLLVLVGALEVKDSHQDADTELRVSVVRNWVSSEGHNISRADAARVVRSANSDHGSVAVYLGNDENDDLVRRRIAFGPDEQLILGGVSDSIAAPPRH
jgi:hypothetical protein